MPFVTTAHSAGPDLLADGAAGWLVPAGEAEPLVSRLEALGGDRQALAAAVGRAYRPRSWDDLARDLEAHVAAVQA